MRLVLRTSVPWAWFLNMFLVAIRAHAAAPMTQEGLASLLRHQETTVRSVECQFSSKRSVTPPNVVPLIRAVCRDQGREKEYIRYVYTAEIATRQSYDAHWWREGSKERIEKSPGTADSSWGKATPPAEITVFNGEEIRRLAGDEEEGRLGAIQTPDRWYTVNRTHPVSFLYEFQNTPYSDLIMRSEHCEISLVDRNGQPWTRVSFRHPDFYSLDCCSFALLFDENDLLVERDVIRKLAQDRTPRIYEKHAFSDYRRYTDSSGERMWFPHHAVYHYYVGDLPDGTHVEYTTRDIKIRDIKFNAPIPDDKFVLEFPKGTRVYDELHQVGWIDEAAERAKSAAEVTRPMSGRRWVLVTCSILLLILTGVLVWRRSNRMERA